ncbi:MAG: glycosyltransferase family 2 protein [Candidatus Hodarchaeales archaeon]
MNKRNIFIIVPAYNEEKTLPSVIQQLETYINRENILIANDGSIDNTIRVTKQYGLESINNEINQGKGFILRKGFEKIVMENPEVDWIITFDADGQHNSQDLPQFFEIINQNSNVSIIIGTRDYHLMPSANRISNLLTSRWCEYWLNWGISDLQCGFRAYYTEDIREILDYGLSCTKFDLETEILLVAWILGKKMTQVPIKTLYEQQRRRSRIAPNLDTLRWMKLMLKFGFQYQFMHKIWQRKKSTLRSEY